MTLSPRRPRRRRPAPLIGSLALATGVGLVAAPAADWSGADARAHAATKPMTSRPAIYSS
ncbi:hypothetical protein KN815_45690 [Streptomyces sp. 4503]|uniref:Uncharacterized protein n=1 Tax=Streptomyces niphimycinicus TaxID=2842201 RepID=A0ABS6CW67_9ACTN|nr:hypothetical protein [Streptomyces niphimycinicus]MBU3871090.1 hypothetical protein [Streptomyces niphimycinicus]